MRWLRVFRTAMAVAVVLALNCVLHIAAQAKEGVTFTVTPAVGGEQLVRTALPLPPGFLRTNRTLVVRVAGGDFQRVGARVLSWHPSAGNRPRTARRALVTFAHAFTGPQPVEFTLEAARSRPQKASAFPVTWRGAENSFRLTWQDGREMSVRLIAPARVSTEPPRLEVVEENPCFRWQRLHLPDPAWPRVLEFRLDAAGGAVLVAHVQRGTTNDHFAPTLGWEVATAAKGVGLQSGDRIRLATRKPLQHSFADGAEAVCWFDHQLSIHHPTAPLKRRGGLEVSPAGERRWTYRYERCQAGDRVPMQPFAWQRVEMVIAPGGRARLTPALTSPHRVELDRAAWTELYAQGGTVTNLPPTLEALVRYHRDAIVRSAAVGDDFGNVTSYSDGSLHGEVYGMNRLNHGAAIFELGRRSQEQRLTETALLWCDNFFDQSIWWGEPQRGGTRYNNRARSEGAPPDPRYMWRSDSAVSFCTKGYDCFWLAWEETGDPRMLEALRAQTAYAAEFIHAHQGECRNVGDVRDFVRLYQYTGEPHYLDNARRLFRELRTKLSPNHLFDQGGKPIDPDPPFIEEDQAGLKVGYAKPYIIGYALAGLPELLPLAPDEPDLKETIRAVADFLAATVDPAGGWRYPHPRSSHVNIGHGMEHAWHLTQAARALGPEAKWLDAIETVLRARLHGWLRTGKILSALQGWEVSTGKVKDRQELYQLYRKPTDRDAARDYTDGNPSYGSASPEGLVYFEEVLGYYLQHRPAARLLAPPAPEEPLGLILARSPARN